MTSSSCRACSRWPRSRSRTSALAELPDASSTRRRRRGPRSRLHGARALTDPRVRSLHVVEALGAVIEWHEDGLLPFAAELTDDPRCHLVNGDFFAMVRERRGIRRRTRPTGSTPCSSTSTTRPATCSTRPRALLRTRRGLLAWPVASTRAACSGCGRRRPRQQVRRPSSGLRDVPAHVVTFPNFYTGGESSSTVYVATAAGSRCSPHDGRRPALYRHLHGGVYSTRVLPHILNTCGGMKSVAPMRKAVVRRASASPLPARRSLAFRPMSGKSGDESRDGVPLTNLDQPLFDGADATKRDLVDYLDARARPDHPGARRTGRCR